MKTETSLFSKALVVTLLRDTFFKLNPKSLVKNPVIFVTAICSLLSSYSTFVHWEDQGFFLLQITIWLWFTVLFALFSEALAEGRGKAQADSLRKIKGSLKARKLISGVEQVVDASQLEKGDLAVCTSGDLIPGDGEVIEGIATVDESAITGESAPVIRESGGDRSAVTAGTRVLSDRIVVRLTVEKGQTFIDRMIKLVEGAQRKKTPNEIALSLLLSALTLVFVLALGSLKVSNDYLATTTSPHGLSLSLPLLSALFVCLIPTTIGGLLSAVGISGMDRLIRKNVIATSGRAVEAAGDVNVLMMDKTGTITFGNRMAEQFYPVRGYEEQALAEACYFSSLADETPEGRSIIDLALKKIPGLNQFRVNENDEVIAFSAHTRMSGLNRTDNEITVQYRKGASDSVAQWVKEQGGEFSSSIRDRVVEIAKRGATPLVVARDHEVLGVIELKDVIKPGMTKRFKQLRQMGIRTVMITGDNPITAAAIAAEAGVDDFMAEASPEDKLQRIRSEQSAGFMVAMTGDGTNDAPALAQADVGVAMNTGTQAAREAGNMVDLDSNPTKLIDIVEVGKQLLMTRGALTTFSVTNDVAKYFAILPALFVTLFATNGQLGPLSQLNLMSLHSPQSAILSAVIFNALIIVFLIPIALRGIKVRALSPQKILLQNVMIYGVGGLILPFAGIKGIDWLIVTLGLIS